MTENRLNISESNGSPDTNGTGDGRTGHSETGYSNSNRQNPAGESTLFRRDGKHRKAAEEGTVP